MHPSPFRMIAAFAAYILAGGLVALAARTLTGAPVVLAVLIGLAVVALALLFHLVASLSGERHRMISWVAEQDRLLPELNERLMQVEENMTTMLGGMTSQQQRQVEGLAAELTLLRQTMERFSGERLSGERRLAAGQADGARPLPQGDASRDAAALLRTALKESRVDLYLQPIVRLPSRKAAYYEAFSRLRDEQGRVFAPGNALETLGADADAALVPLLDNLLLFRSINLIRRVGRRRPEVKLFCNMSTSSLTDGNFLPELADFLRQQPELTGRLVLEFAARDLARVPEAAQAYLAELAGLGFAFSVDNVTDPATLNAAQLAALNVRFVKVDAAVLLEGEAAQSRALLAGLAQQGLTLIATRIETDRAVAEVLDLGVTHGQGFLFGEPRPGRGTAGRPTETPGTGVGAGVGAGS